MSELADVPARLLVDGAEGSEAVMWLSHPLQVGDEVTVRLVETDSIDAEILRQPVVDDAP